MSNRFHFHNPQSLYFISSSIVNWIDLFMRKIYIDILLNTWRFAQKEKGLEIYGWCLMTSHFHMIARSKHIDIAKVFGEMKTFSSRSLKAAIKNEPGESRRDWLLEMMVTAGLRSSCNEAFQLWQHSNHPIEIRTRPMFFQKLDYMHYNPVKAGIVQNPEDYLLSSARDFYGKKGLIDLTQY